MDKWKVFMFFMGFVAIALIAMQPQQIKMVVDQIRSDQSDFIERWDNRIKTSNRVNNQTQQKVVHTGEMILGNVTQEFANLTQHRIVTNSTFDKVTALIIDLNETETENNRLLEENNDLIRQAINISKH